MKKPWLRILLMLSLAMNAGILGTLLYQWFRPEKMDVAYNTNPAPSEPFAYNDPTLRRHYQEALAKNRTKLEFSRKARRSFVSSLAEENFNEQKSHQLLKEFLSARADMETSLGESLINFRSKIKDPKQVEAFNQRIRERNTRLENISHTDSLASDSTSIIRDRIKSRIKDRVMQRRAARRRNFGK